MGTIKLPNNSIEFFKSNQNKIFESGNLAEGPWNEQLSEKIQTIANVKKAICVNSNGSGLVALLLHRANLDFLFGLPLHTCLQ